MDVAVCYQSDAMDIRQRLVRFGTSFRAAEKEERSEECSPVSEVLCSNEIVVDVGSTCWGWRRLGAEESEARRIIDHHFDRPDQYPSASAAVLDLSPEIWEWSS